MAKNKLEGIERIEARRVIQNAPSEPIYKKCHSCGGEMQGRHQNYEYKECGLNNVVLIDVLVFHCKCGEIVAQIPAISILHRLIAFELIKKPTLLSAEEVRYLRKFVGYGATEFADALGTTKVTMSRWENGVTKITKNTDRVLRIAFFMIIVEQDAELVTGSSGDSTRVPCVIAFAKKVKTFNLMSFLKRIKDTHEQSAIKIDPGKLAEFGASDFSGECGSPTLVN